MRVSVSTFFTSIRRRSEPRLQKGPITIKFSKGEKIISATDCRTEIFKIRDTRPVTATGELYESLVVIRDHFSHCERVSRRIRRVFQRCASVMRPLSLSRTFLSIARGGGKVRLTISITQRVGTQVERIAKLATSTKISCGGFLTGITSS